MKKCTKCGVEKPLTEFTKQASRRDGFCNWCKACKAAQEKAWRKENPERYGAINTRNYLNHCEERKEDGRARYALKGPEICASVKKADLKRRYGLTPETKAKLVEEQKGCCAICNSPFQGSPNVDHTHGSNPVIVRGLLCLQCNVGLGNFKDSPERLLNAVAYLKKFPEKT